MIVKLKIGREEFQDVLIADSFMKRFFGYMFRKKPHHNAILFKPCNSIHSFFMRFNIDVIFLNENMKIVKKIDNLKRGKVIMPVKEGKVVVEGASGTLKNLCLGDTVKVISNKGWRGMKSYKIANNYIIVENE